MHLQALWRVRSYARPHYRTMALMILAALTGTVVAAYLPVVTQRLIDGPLSTGDRPGVAPLALLALGVGLVDGGLAFVRRLMLAYAATDMETVMRNDFYAHVQRLDLAFHDKWQTGQLLSRANSDISVIRRFFGFGLVFFVVNICTFIYVIGLLATVHAGLAIVTALGFVPVPFISRSFNRDYGRVTRKVQDQTGDLTTQIEEAAQGLRVIKAYGRRRTMLRKFMAASEEIRDSSLEQTRLRARFFGTLGFVPKAAQALVLLVGAYSVANGSLSEGELVMFLSLMIMLVWPVESLGEILSMAEESATAAERIYEVFDTPASIADAPDARDAVDVGAASVRFENVSFTFPGASAPVLDRVNLDVRPGETLALVGATGSGKTTLLAMIGRLTDPTAGRVLLDGVDARALTLASLRARVSVAFDDPTLFSASVRENVLLGSPDLDDDQLRTALQVASAEFAYDLPWGLNTRVGEQGISLSGGQRQRLALARAVVGRPAVLVMDDPLSALDVRTEQAVHVALHEVLADVTAIIAVHRPSTVALADRVAFLHDGRIAAIGTHEELLANNEQYAAVIGDEAEVLEHDSEEVA
ncbi:MAG: ABC transporter ATP-binding protein [Acidimicrobiales bacterium]|nr:ABC transporter ATP-binding protein [Acidimicrobiales bacterium]